MAVRGGLGVTMGGPVAVRIEWVGFGDHGNESERIPGSGLTNR